MQDTTTFAPAPPLLRGIAIWHVKLDEQGRAVFFPHGAGGKGRVVEDARKLRLVLWLALTQRMAPVLALIPLLLVIRHVLGGRFALPLIFLPAVLLFGSVIAQRLMLARLPVSECRLRSREVQERREQGLAPAADWIQLCLAIGLFALGVDRLVKGDAELAVLAWLLILPAALLAFVTLRCMWKYRARRVAQ